jgi:hypothetical protein
MRLLSTGVTGLTMVAGLVFAAPSSGAVPVMAGADTSRLAGSWSGTRDAAAGSWSGTRDAAPGSWSGTRDGLGGSWSRTRDATAGSWSRTRDATAGSWSDAQDVPSVGGDWSVLSAMSCTAPGDCTAGGEYGWDEPYTQGTGLVVSETDGTWGKAADVPGISELAGRQFAAVTGLSCAWPGNCAAVGYYLPSADATTGQAFVANETGGVWQPARALPGITEPLDNLAAASPWTIEVSCAAATTAMARRQGLNCVAGGSYAGRTGLLAFVAESSNGTWAAPHQVPGLVKLGYDYGGSHVLAVSCASSGNCAIGGSYTDDNKQVQAFAATEANGRWSPAAEVPGIAALNRGGLAQLDSLDCPAAGHCTAAGSYAPQAGPAALFVINEADGQWHRAIRLPGSAGRDSDGGSIAQVSCVAAACAVGGTLTTSATTTSGFIASETDGKWGAPDVLPGTLTSVSALSCPVAGQCAAGGTEAAPDSAANGIVLDQVNGAWGSPRAVAAGAGIGAAITALSCAAARACAAAAHLPQGWSGGPWAAIASESPGPSPR